MLLEEEVFLLLREVEEKDDGSFQQHPLDMVEGIHRNIVRCPLWGYCKAYFIFRGFHDAEEYGFTSRDYRYLLKRGGFIGMDEEKGPLFIRNVFQDKDPLFLSWLRHRTIDGQ